ncbi:MAG TPA: type II secretion system minor pseudopilin GspJ [Sulfuricaulis sp.]|nr:type II secretion system minor pseudopilin GspJ [Sulfuricaulis sp.]
MKRDKGFTLLELLVAIGIFALISAIAYGSLIRLMNDRARLESEHNFWRSLSLTFTRLEDDFSQARERSIRDVIGFSQPAFRGQPTDIRAIALPSVEMTRGGVLSFGDTARPDLQRVGYRLVDGTLMRLTWPVLDLGPQTVPVETPILKNVEEFRVRFYAPAGAWIDVWPAEGISEILPRGVEVRLKLTGRGEFTRLMMVNG